MNLCIYILLRSNCSDFSKLSIYCLLYIIVKITLHCVFSTDNLPDHPTKLDPVAYGVEDVPACHLAGRSAEVCGQKLPGQAQRPGQSQGQGLHAQHLHGGHFLAFRGSLTPPGAVALQH